MKLHPYAVSNRRYRALGSVGSAGRSMTTTRSTERKREKQSPMTTATPGATEGKR